MASTQAAAAILTAFQAVGLHKHLQQTLLRHWAILSIAQVQGYCSFYCIRHRTRQICMLRTFSSTVSLPLSRSCQIQCTFCMPSESGLYIPLLECVVHLQVEECAQDGQAYIHALSIQRSTPVHGHSTRLHVPCPPVNCPSNAPRRYVGCMSCEEADSLNLESASSLASDSTAL